MDANQPTNPYAFEWLELVRKLPPTKLEEFASKNIPATLPLATAYIDTLNNEDKAISLRSSILVYVASNGRLVPRQYQLESNNALAHGLDCVVDSGTGSGKTLCQIIPNLLFPNTTSITISPLKRLQILQAAEFEKWGIRTVCINEDTPSDVQLWDQIRDGHFQHLIVQPEQLKMYQGHLPRLARLLNVPRFVKTIARVHVDEAHTHYSAGLAHYGLPPFRPSWGALNEFRLRLPKGTPFQALSGTFPLHIKTAVIEHLNFDLKSFVSLELSSNRPNIVYATHRIVGSLADFRNLDFLIAIPFTSLVKCIIFHDDTQQFRHYHGGMSKDYLTQVFDDFSKPNGVCKILSATEGASTGLDVEDIAAVIDYGIPQSKGTALQRGGRCGRRGQQAVYLVMAEPWAYTASLEAVETDSNDPDRPISGRLTKHARKPARTGLAMILYVRTENCLRAKIMSYLDDVSANALAISTPWCCDRVHPDEPLIQFDKRSFFPGRFIYTDDTGAIYAGNVDEDDRQHLNPPRGRKRKAKGLPNRKVAERAPLQEHLRTWLRTAHAADPLRAVRPASFILDAKSIKALSTVHQDRMKSVEQVVAAVEETTEWATQWGDAVLAVLTHFDAQTHPEVPEPPTASRRKPKENRKPGDTDWEPRQKKAKAMPVLAEVPPNVRRSGRLAGKKDNDEPSE
ncbi:P-loop containing nucleoside triphosphate hydrolase protein [Mycena latifolia]|nr:P-loop containing nucleoside triphosphate hydrolase protein [Mycena latifolia]